MQQNSGAEHIFLWGGSSLYLISGWVLGGWVLRGESIN